MTRHAGVFGGLVCALLSITLPATSSRASADGWQRYRVSDPQTTLKRINNLRVSYGAHAIVEDPAWSIGCAKHMTYVGLHGLTHVQTPGAAGFSDDGAEAGATSVLQLPASEPFVKGQLLGAWTNAPYHQVQVLDPLLARTGFSLGCMNTLRGRVMPPEPPFDEPVAEEVPQPPPIPALPPRLVVWPGQGAKGVPRTISACGERPSNPFTDVGWSCGGVGTAFYVYALDPSIARCSDVAGQPGVTVTSNGRTIPSRVMPGGCAWIVITGRALPARADVQLVVTHGGSTLTRTFSTVPRKAARKAKPVR